jgi:hypothetical protein
LRAEAVCLQRHGRLHQRRLAGDRDRLGHRTHFELECLAHGLTCSKLDAALADGFESGQLDAQGIWAGGERGEKRTRHSRR